MDVKLNYSETRNSYDFSMKKVVISEKVKYKLFAIIMILIGIIFMIAFRTEDATGGFVALLLGIALLVSPVEKTNSKREK